MLNFFVSLLLFAPVVIIIVFDKLAMSWPATEGKLMKSLVVESKNIKIYSCYVLFSYEIDGRKYISDKRVFLDGIYRDKRRADKKINFLQKKSSLSVYYFPMIPSISVLQPGRSNRVMLLFIFIMSVIFFLTGLAISAT